MQVGSKVRVIVDSYPGEGHSLNTGGKGVILGYTEQGAARCYAVKIEGFREPGLSPPEAWAAAGTLKGGWAYLEGEIEEDV